MFANFHRVAVCALLTCTAALPARAIIDQIVIDDFSVQTPLLSTSSSPSSATSAIVIDSQTASRLAQVTGSSGVINGQVNSSGVFEYGAFPSTQNENLGSLGYSLFSIDISSTPILALDLTNIQGAGSAFIQVESTSGLNPELTGLYVLPTTSSGFLFVDLRDMVGYDSGFLTGVDSLLVGFEGANDPFFGIDLGEVSFVSPGLAASVPEPVSWPVMGITTILLGAAFLRRRLMSSER